MINLTSALFFILCFLSSPMFAQTDEYQSVQVAVGDNLITAKVTKDLTQLKDHFVKNEYAACVRVAVRAVNKVPEVRGWISILKLKCATQDYLRNKKGVQLSEQIESVWKNSDALLFGISAKKLRIELINSSLILLEGDLLKNRNRAWSRVSELVEAKEWLEPRQEAKLYRYAGELSFAEQKLNLARDYFEKSLALDANAGVKSRLSAVLKALNLKPEVEVASDKIARVEATQEELEIYNRMKSGIKSGDLISAVEDGIKLMLNFSGGKRAEEASQDILNIFMSLAQKNDEKYADFKNQILAQMRRADGQRQFEWAQLLFQRENYFESLSLAKNSIEQVSGQPIATKVLMLAALSAQHISDFKSASEYFEILIREHAGTKVAAEALFRIGLLEYRQAKYADAINRFEKFLLLEHNSDFELSAMYWLWRSKQQVDKENSSAFGQNIIQKYPISYYGLRAQAELGNGKILLPKEPTKKPIWTFFFTASERAAWNRFLILKKAKWYEEAQAELSFFEEPASAEGKIILAYLWSEIDGYYRASEILSRAYTLDKNQVSIMTLQVAYPKNFIAQIKKETSRYKLPPEILMALIKQESSFRTNVVSPAGAVGLTQLMPATAREVAKDMRVKLKNVSQDLMQPDLNIKIGAQYLHRRIKSFNGHVPLALASYNAGIGNIRAWLKVREDLGQLERQFTSSPQNEIWIDELPWVETTGYVKSILRNYIIYRTLDQGVYELQSPIWKL